MRIRVFSMLLLILVLSLSAISARADIFGTNAPSAASYVVIAQTLVSNNAPISATVVTGDLAVSPAGACTGFINPTCGGSAAGTISGAIHLADGPAATALGNAEAAELALLSTVIPAPQALGTAILGQASAMVLAPGIYTYTSAAQLTGTLTLAAAGNLAPVWIFEIPTLLTTSTNNAHVVVTDTTGGAGIAAAGVYWVVGSLTLGDNTDFLGNIMAETDITFDPGAQDICGRAFSDTQVVFKGMDPTSGRQNVISNTCTQSTSGLNGGVITPGGGVGPGAPVPEPGTLGLLASGLLLGIFLLGFRKSRVSSLSRQDC
jgi:hypothetical protein